MSEVRCYLGLRSRTRSAQLSHFGLSGLADEHIGLQPPKHIGLQAYLSISVFGLPGNSIDLQAQLRISVFRPTWEFRSSALPGEWSEQMFGRKARNVIARAEASPRAQARDRRPDEIPEL
jgi:hypothetical protein